MEPKKNKDADIEKKKITLFLLGLVASLSLMLVYTELRSATVGDSKLPDEKKGIEIEEIIEIQLAQEVTPPPPPPPPPPVPDIIEVVDDKKDVKETEIKTNKEADEKFVIVEEEIKGPVIEEVFTIVEKNPSFPGGIEKLYEYLGKNIKYPQMAREAGVKGKVFIEFVVWKDGTIRDIKVLRGIGMGCDNEALRVVEKMPNWEPGEQRGKKVPVKFTLPIDFKLQ